MLSVAWLLASTACSSIDTASGEHGATITLVTGTEQDADTARIQTPRVNPGQPYNQGLWPDP
jgi:hypothetical protein